MGSLKDRVGIITGSKLNYTGTRKGAHQDLGRISRMKSRLQYKIWDEIEVTVGLSVKDHSFT